MNKIIYVVLCLIFLFGCEEKSYSVEYYKQHEEKAREKIKWCKKQEKLRKKDTVECSNADTALFFSNKNDKNKAKKNLSLDELVDIATKKK